MVSFGDGSGMPQRLRVTKSVMRRGLNHREEAGDLGALRLDESADRDTAIALGVYGEQMLVRAHFATAFDFAQLQGRCEYFVSQSSSCGNASITARRRAISASCWSQSSQLPWS